jgi:hypothetical protein
MIHTADDDRTIGGRGQAFRKHPRIVDNDLRLLCMRGKTGEHQHRYRDAADTVQ